MTKKSKSGLRSLSRELISGKHHDDWVREIESGSDRAVAIIAVANLEITIERLILHHLPRGEDEEVAESLRKPEGSLSTFYQKIDIAHAMELITDSGGAAQNQTNKECLCSQPRLPDLCHSRNTRRNTKA